MSCTSSKRIVAEELQSYLDFIISDNSKLEQLRNELKSSFHQRPTEEKNIIKDVLAMHSEFDSGISRINQIVEKLKNLPTEKVENTAHAEVLAIDMVKLQSSLVNKHEILNKLSTQKQHFKRLKEEATEKLQRKQQEFNEMQFKVTEIENFEHGTLYNKKLRLLNAELARLKNPSSTGSFSLLDNDSRAAGLTTAQATIKLHEQLAENKKLEEEIWRINSRFLTKDQFLSLKKEINAKSKRVEELQRVLKNVNSNITELGSPGRRDSVLKIKLLDSIVGRKSPFSPLPTAEVHSPRNNSRSSTLLQTIEASLLRVRSITSPIPKG